MTLFITFEGPEGSGKTTQVQLLAEALMGAGWPVLSTREPGGTRIGNAIRNLLLDMAHTEMAARTETLLFNAARAQIVEQVIRPALTNGQVVLCDRYADSTLAYQGYGHGQALDELRMLIRYATDGLTPDLTVYLDIDPEAGLQRKRNAGAPEWNRLDAKQLAYHKSVRAGYLAIAASEPERWLIVEAAAPRESVHRQILISVQERLRQQAEESQ